MTCIWNVKEEERHCEFCTARFCDDRQPQAENETTTNYIGNETEKGNIEDLHQGY